MTSVITNLEQWQTKSPEATEIFSGSYLIDGQNSELFASLQRSFPKVGAVEMEAGAVAQAVLHSIDTERFLGYLVIKGISDVVDSSVAADARKPIRKAFAQLASVSSAEFAKHMIGTWTGNTGQLYGHVALVPPKYMAHLSQGLWNKRYSNSIVYEGIHLSRYSQLLDRFFKEQVIKSAWTFCYLAPYRFFAALDPKLDQDNRSRDHALQAAKNVLAEYANNKPLLSQKLHEHFPHFRVLAELAATDKEKAMRIMHQGPDWRKENELFLVDFVHMNAGVPCYLLDDHDLDGEEWVHRDQVIINNDLLFDFDEEHKRLVITYLDPNGLGEDFRRFKEHCTRKGAGKELKSDPYE